MGAAKALLMERLERDPLFRERYDLEDESRLEPGYGDMDVPLPYPPDSPAIELDDPGLPF